MTQFQHPQPNAYEAPTDNSPGGLAITGFILSLLGLILTPLALVGLILGIIGLARKGRKHWMNIAAVCISATAMLVGCLMMGIMLPALGKARQSARQIKSSTQARGIGQALTMYAMDNKNVFPEAGADWKKRLVDGNYIRPEVFTAPQAQPGDESYFYIPGGTAGFSQTKVLIIENPEFYRGIGANVVFEDTTVHYLTGDEFWTIVEKQKANGVNLPFTRQR